MQSRCVKAWREKKKKEQSRKKKSLLFLSTPALILPLSRTLPHSTGVKVFEGGSVRKRGRIKAGVERWGIGVARRTTIGQLQGEGRDNYRKMVDTAARWYIPPVTNLLGGVEQDTCPFFVSTARHVQAASAKKQTHKEQKSRTRTDKVGKKGFRANKCRIRQQNPASDRIQPHETTKNLEKTYGRQKNAVSNTMYAVCGGKKTHGRNKNVGKKLMRSRNAASGIMKDHTGKTLPDRKCIRQKKNSSGKTIRDASFVCRIPHYIV